MLGAGAAFNHGNLRIALSVDRVLRWFVMTPDMHRVHHSIEDDETNSNFGFNVPLWDRLFATYRGQPRAGHEAMTIGIHGFRAPPRVRSPSRHVDDSIIRRGQQLRDQSTRVGRARIGAPVTQVSVRKRSRKGIEHGDFQ